MVCSNDGKVVVSLFLSSLFYFLQDYLWLADAWSYGAAYTHSAKT